MFVIRDFQAEAIHSFDVANLCSLTWAMRLSMQQRSLVLSVAIRAAVSVTAPSPEQTFSVLHTTHHTYIRLGRCD